MVDVEVEEHGRAATSLYAHDKVTSDDRCDWHSPSQPEWELRSSVTKTNDSIN